MVAVRLSWTKRGKQRRGAVLAGRQSTELIWCLAEQQQEQAAAAEEVKRNEDGEEVSG